MQQFINLTGNKYGKLTVTGSVRRKLLAGQKRTYCQVTCECDKVFWAMRDRLVNGRLTQCQECAKQFRINRMRKQSKFISDNKIHRRLSFGEASFNKLFYIYQRNAKNRNRTFTITKIEFKELTASNCHYCGKPPTNHFGEPGSNGDYAYNGIDRKNNSIGYELSNCLSCCGICNKAKGTLGYEEFILFIKTAAANLSARGEI